MGKVIVVEDSPSQLTDICDKLHDAGFETAEAVSVCSAKQVIEQASPLDIVLADMRLPDGQCFAILEWMKEKGYSQPFIMMSRYQDESTLQTAINNGVTRFVNKKRLDEELIVYVREQMEEQSRLAIRFGNIALQGFIIPCVAGRENSRGSTVLQCRRARMKEH